MAESIDIRELNEKIEAQSGFITDLVTGMNQTIVGQKHLIDSLLIGLLSGGHILLEGVPGLAKTLAIKTLSKLVDATPTSPWQPTSAPEMDALNLTMLPNKPAVANARKMRISLKSRLF